MAQRKKEESAAVSVSVGGKLEILKACTQAKEVKDKISNELNYLLRDSHSKTSAEDYKISESYYTSITELCSILVKKMDTRLEHIVINGVLGMAQPKKDLAHVMAVRLLGYFQFLANQSKEINRSVIDTLKHLKREVKYQMNTPLQVDHLFLLTNILGIPLIQT